MDTSGIIPLQERSSITNKHILGALVLNAVLMTLGFCYILDLPSGRSVSLNQANRPNIEPHVIKIYKPDNDTRTIDIPSPDDCEGSDKSLRVDIPLWSDLNRRLVKVKHGGRYQPIGTLPTRKLVIIVPYRDRRVHLKLFLDRIHPFLQRQNLYYVIYVVEMEREGKFRKTVIMNAGFLEVIRRENVSCVIYHDVDLIPIDDKNLYYCEENSIRHLASSIPQFGYRIPYSTYIGGVIAFPTNLYKSINGFSNLYSGWGGEDDDMFERIRALNISLTHQDMGKGRYDSWPHARQPILTNRGEYLKTAVERMQDDGLNSVKYRVVKIEERPLFTWILIRTNHTSDAYKDTTPNYKLDPRVDWRI